VLLRRYHELLRHAMAPWLIGAKQISCGNFKTERNQSFCILDLSHFFLSLSLSLSLSWKVRFLPALCDNKECHKTLGSVYFLYSYSAWLHQMTRHNLNKTCLN